MKDDIIQARELRKVFNDLTAVDGISFQVKKGELFGILGPNGAGKTTTIRMLYGFSPMTSGDLSVFGLDIGADWRAIRSRIGVCHQENNLDPDLSVRENLEVFGRYFGMRPVRTREQADRLLAFIGMDQRAGAKVSELSGGMMRRVILARALLNDPELLILDEPTTGLDPQSRHLVWDRLAELKRQGVTILLTTHYMEEAARLCDRLIIIDHGRILVEGKPHDLVAKFVGRQVVESSPICDGLRAFVKARELEHEDLGARMIVYCKDDDRRGKHEHVAFDFLGYTFQPRRAKNRFGKFFVSFLPAISTRSAVMIRAAIRQWRMASIRSNQRLEDLARLVNPSVRGWMNYYGRFYRSKCVQVLRHLNEALAGWARRKYKRLRRRERASRHWLGGIAQRDPNLFVLWQLGVRPEAGS
jgi:lipooligosaccharide transport system ATP-binding protein